MSEEIKQLWWEASDESVIKAASVDKSEYPPEVQAIIEGEVQTRGLTDEVEQRRRFLKEKVEKKVNWTRKLANRNRIVSIVVLVVGTAAILLLERLFLLSRMDVLVALLGLALVSTFLWEERPRSTTIAVSIAGVAIILALERVFTLTLGYVLLALFVLFIIVHTLDRILRRKHN